MRFIPHKITLAQTSDGPPSLECNGSERRAGAVSSSSLRFLSPTRGTEGVVKTIDKEGFEKMAPAGLHWGGRGILPAHDLQEETSLNFSIETLFKEPLPKEFFSKSTSIH